MIVLLAAGTVTLAGCSSSKPSSQPSPVSPPTVTTAAVPTTSSTTVPASTTTTVYAPTAPQTSADAAGAALVNFWSEGNRAAAATVAAPPAVTSLFAVPYPGSALTIPRGCGDVPTVCTYGPNGGADPNDAIYELYVTQVAGGGWYVSSVIVES